MKLEETIYWIAGSIPKDDFKPAMDVKKLVQLGDNKNYKYIWVAIDHNGGIGTAQQLDKIGSDTIIGALLQVHRFLSMDDRHFIKEMSFDEMIQRYTNLKQELEAKMLNDKNKE